jgi:hypothetical protein
MPRYAVTVNDNGVRKRVVLESATEPTEAEVLSALREDYSFLSDSDFHALKKGDYSSISDKGLLALKSKQTSSQSTNLDLSQKTSMPIEAEIEGIGILQFPDGTSREVIQATAKRVVSAYHGSLGGTQPDKLVQKSLSEQDRLRLDGIVSKMESNGERPEDIRFVVNDFKAKYERAAAPTNPVQKAESNPLTQSDIDQLGRLKTESVGIIKNPPEVSILLDRTSTNLFLTGWVVSLLAAFAVAWILARRRYNRQPGEIRTTNQEAVSNPASFRCASLGVRRLASTLFWLFTIGCISAGIVSGGSDFRFLVSVGLIMGLFSWVLIRGIDWIFRGFKFGGYDIDGKR